MTVNFGDQDHTQCDQAVEDNWLPVSLQHLTVAVAKTILFCIIIARATRMHSADYAMARCLCPSVRHTPVFCLNDYTYPQSFSPSGSPTILVFPHQTGWQYSDGKPLTGASNVRWYENNHDFRPISCIISEMMQDRAIVTMDGE